MASTTFIDNQTTIYAAWLNDVNNAVYNGVFASPTITATSMVCTGSASGSGFTTLINNTFSSPGAIGSTTPNTGKFTTLQATSLTGLTTPLSVSQGGTGLSTVGTSGYALASNGSTIAYRKLGLGMTGESWLDVTSSRALSTNYTNNRTYPIMIFVVTGTNSGGSGTTIFINGSGVVARTSFSASGAGGAQGCGTIVPPGATYYAAGNSLDYWCELF